MRFCVAGKRKDEKGNVCRDLTPRKVREKLICKD